MTKKARINQQMGQNNQKDQKGPKMTAAVMLVQNNQNNQKIWSSHISHTILKVRFFWDTLYVCVTSFPHTTGCQLIGLSHVVTSGPRVCTRASPNHPPPFATPKFPSNCSLLLLDLQQFKNQLFITPISLQQQQLLSCTPHLNIHSLSGQ